MSMPFYEIPASNYEIPTYAGIETPFYRVAEDTLLGPAVPVATDATQTAIAYPHYFGTDFDGTYDSVNTPIMQEQQEAFRQSMADAAAAGNRGDYGLQAGYIWDAYNPGFAVLAQIGMLPRAIGQVISAGRAASRAKQEWLDSYLGTMDRIAADSVQQTPTAVPIESSEPIDTYLGALERLGNAKPVPTPTPTPTPTPAPPTPAPRFNRWGQPI